MTAFSVGNPMSTRKHPEKGLTYQDAGVDIHKANRLIGNIKTIAKRTHRPGVVNELGGFGAFFQIPSHYQQPLLVSGTDGVGTKLKLAHSLNRHDTIGIDLVAMCVNDIICHGAEPLFFLDYYAAGQLDLNQSAEVIKGIGRGCELAGAALIGGETAEMPGMYSNNDYDLAGFCVGVVEQSKVIDGHEVQVGDAVIGLAASGPHSNGYSLIRKVVEVAGANYNDPFEKGTLGSALLTPTRIYVKSILNVLKHVEVHGIANITGGGLLENIPRCLPKGTKAVLDKNSWQPAAIFNWLQQQGNISNDEMYRSFNVGIGMVMIVPAKDTNITLDCLRATNENAWVIGSIESSTQEPAVIIE